MHITIIYSSGGGNTKLVIDKVCELLAQHTIQTQQVNAITASPEDLLKTDITILAAPTYDHGVIHTPYERYLYASKDIDMTGHSYAIIGLGDNKYDDEYNVESAVILKDFVSDQGGTIVGDILKINKSPVDQLETTITQRTQHLVTSISND